jgi:hypothetical protein
MTKREHSVALLEADLAITQRRISGDTPPHTPR